MLVYLKFNRSVRTRALIKTIFQSDYFCNCYNKNRVQLTASNCLLQKQVSRGFFIQTFVEIFRKTSVVNSVLEKRGLGQGCFLETRTTEKNSFHCSKLLWNLPSSCFKSREFD